jgi:hypothetical protein
MVGGATPPRTAVIIQVEAVDRAIVAATTPVRLVADTTAVINADTEPLA